ncbi:type IV pilus modification protein PilV [Massilia sp. RP-1-19]|uniref:Type IV pilus modification protein PilV n=1 Tax=Massilia polaris TaxID=2728846 RepID=A0A848HDZ9_9BURK|nr:type IV pilus modification protein PilV [Massilia polaris]NML60046.1 type IV pilus modification protein PilV [Massilia polaris]
MTHLPYAHIRRQRGTTLVEVLVTVVVLAFGLLGIAAFQAKAQVGSIEAYQRAQAVVLLEDLQARMSGNPAQAAGYVTDAETPLGTDDEPGNCSTLTERSARDKCEWSTALQGAAEVKGEADVNAGAMLGARGCVTEIQARDAAPGVCQPGIYQLTVAWQGMHATRAPSHVCGNGEYGAETHRRAIGARVAVGVPDCK